MRMKSFSKLVLAMALPLCLSVSAADAKTLWANPDNAENNFSIGGDLRFRYEMDHDSSQSGSKKKDRTRSRIRIRVGGVYNTGSGIEAGWQLATGSDSLHSPHQDLGMNGSVTTTTTTTISGTTATSKTSLAKNPAFGTDKGYIKYKTGGFSIWGGKNSWGIMQVSEAWLDGDINPEGINLGFKTGGLEAMVAQYIFNQNSFTSADDTMLMYGLKYGNKEAGYDVAYYGISTSEAAAGNLAGGATTYSMLEGKMNVGMWTLGAEYFLSGMDDAHVGAGAKSSDKNGMTVLVGAKLSDSMGVKLFYYDIGQGAVLEKGAYAQDDFAYSANFTGTRLQLDLKPVDGLDVDLRWYNQATKNKNLTAASGNMSGDNTDSRIQLNFNVKF